MSCDSNAVCHHLDILMLFFNFRLIDEGSRNKDKQKHHRTQSAHCCPICIMNFKRQSMSWTAKIKFINKPDIFCTLQVKLTFYKNDNRIAFEFDFLICHWLEKSYGAKKEKEKKTECEVNYWLIIVWNYINWDRPTFTLRFVILCTILLHEMQTFNYAFLCPTKDKTCFSL